MDTPKPSSPLKEESPTPREKLDPVSPDSKARGKDSDEKKSVANSGSDVFYEGEIFEPPHLNRVVDKGGIECWKLTCFCDKRILSPLKCGHPVGRCPKCGRRLRLPGYRPDRKAEVPATSKTRTISVDDSEVLKNLKPDADEKKKKPDAGLTLDEKIAIASEEFAKKQKLKDALIELSANETSDTPSNTPSSKDLALDVDESEDDIGTIIMEPMTEAALEAQIQKEKEENHHADKAAALLTADRLRRHNISTVSKSGPGLISAWPLAGRLPRALSGFIDITLCMLGAGLVLVLAHSKIGLLPPAFADWIVVVTVFLLVGIMNDLVLQLLGGGVGKRIVVLVLREHRGRTLSMGKLILRCVLKWVFMPGWILALFDPAERTLHDRVCGTLVLKGRNR